jgi:hypothetical protein
MSRRPRTGVFAVNLDGGRLLLEHELAAVIGMHERDLYAFTLGIAAGGTDRDMYEVLAMCSSDEITRLRAADLIGRPWRKETLS